MRNRTYRVVDGERIEGTWRPVFINNGGQYFLTDLKVFADGAIWCWEWVDLAGLRDKLASGRVATTIAPDARGSAHEVASWHFGEPRAWFTAEELLGEVADMLDRLNDRPDSTDRCLAAVDRFVSCSTEEDRLAVRAAYQAIPAHRRIYALGDMDHRDVPLRLLCAGLGEVMDGYTVHDLEEAEDRAGEYGNLVVTEQVRQWALDYFLQRERERERERVGSRESRGADGPEGAEAATIQLNLGWPMYPAAHGLRNDYPAPVVVAGVEYPTVTHAYWALSTDDDQARDQIRTAPRVHDAQELGHRAARRPDWALARTAVMAALMRAKFAQHPDLAEILVATGDARLGYGSGESGYWDTNGTQGRNWNGRILELVRSELNASASGIPLP